MAQSNSASKAPKKSAPAPKKSNTASNNGFAVVSKTTITTLQNSNGVKRVIRETTSAPRKQKSKAPTKPAPKKVSNKKK